MCHLNIWDHTEIPTCRCPIRKKLHLCEDPFGDAALAIAQEKYKEAEEPKDPKDSEDPKEPEKPTEPENDSATTETPSSSSPLYTYIPRQILTAAEGAEFLGTSPLHPILIRTS